MKGTRDFIVLAVAALLGTLIGSAHPAHSSLGALPAVQFSKPGSAPAPQAPGSSCDPNYSGACVPIASDVDCAGGSGNGPAYVSGPVRVVGNDIYGLDRDGDGVGCDS